MTPNYQGINRFVFHEITDGDRLKFEARSNTSATGGGARDLRFPELAFGSRLRAMFPSDTGETTNNGGSITSGEMRWIDNDDTERVDVVEYWPPTDARPAEARLARIHEIEGLRDRVPPPGERTFLILLVNRQGEVFAEFVTESQLTSPEFERAVADPILQCMASSAGHRSEHVQGWVDFITDEAYCHGG